MARKATGRTAILSLRTTEEMETAAHRMMQRERIPTVNAFLERAVAHYLEGR